MTLHRQKTGRVPSPSHTGVLAVNAGDSPLFTLFPCVEKVLPLHHVAHRITRAGSCFFEVGENASGVGEFQGEVGEFDVEVGEKAPEVVVKPPSDCGEILLCRTFSTRVLLYCTRHKARSWQLAASSCL